MLPVARTTTQNCAERDIQIKDKPSKKKTYNKPRRKQLCTNFNCYKVARIRGLCEQHIKELHKPQQSGNHSPMSDFFEIEHDNSKSRKRNNLEEEEDQFNDDDEITTSSNTNTASPTNNNCISTSSITITSANISSVTLTENSINKDVYKKASNCQYTQSSTNSFRCENQGTYRCPHCDILFCLQHGLKHQDDLKLEIHTLMTKTQIFFDNIQNLNLVDIKTSCTNHLDQWAMALHKKIDQIRGELQMTLDHFDERLQVKTDQLRTYLANELEQKVGCILTEQLQQFEIDKPKIEKASLEYNRLENLFNSFNNRQLITMLIDSENEMTLNPPAIICSDILLNEADLTGNIQEHMEWSGEQNIESTDNSTSQPEFFDEIKDNSDTRTTSTEIDINRTTNEVVEDIMTNTNIETMENLSDLSTNIFQDLFDENMFNTAIDNVLVEEVISSSTIKDLEEKSELQDMNTEPISTSLPRSSKFNVEQLSAKKQKGSELDLSSQELTDQDMLVVIQYALENSTLTQPFKVLDISCNQIGSKGMNYLSNTLQKNTTLTKLSLHTNHLQNRGAQYMASVLQKNTSITELDISRNQIGFNGMFFFSTALKKNKTLTVLNLEHNPIGPKGIQFLCSALDSNNTLKSLKLNRCSIDEIGAHHLSKTLKTHPSITILELAGNQLGEAGALCFMHVLRHNSTIIVLNLESNQIGETGTVYLCDGLRNNTTLCELNLEQNDIRDTGTKYICDTLKNNSTLTTLNLSNNMAGRAGAQYISTLLLNNTTLKSLDFSFNEIRSIGSNFISDALCKNKTLTALYLQHNRIGQGGVQTLLDAIKENHTLTILNIKGNNNTPADELYVNEHLMENKKRSQRINKK